MSILSLLGLVPRHADTGYVRNVFDAVGGRGFLVLLVVAVIKLRRQLAHALSKLAPTVVGPPLKPVEGTIPTASTETAVQAWHYVVE